MYLKVQIPIQIVEDPPWGKQVKTEFNPPSLKNEIEGGGNPPRPRLWPGQFGGGYSNEI